ncbi:hypothetical protein PAMP_002258 [Pampus punctatissimus]
MPSLAVWFAEWVMAVSRAICTGAKAPVTFARGRAAIKETGGSVARIALQTHCQKQRQRSGLPPDTPDHQQHTSRQQELASYCSRSFTIWPLSKPNKPDKKGRKAMK